MADGEQDVFELSASRGWVLVYTMFRLSFVEGLSWLVGGFPNWLGIGGGVIMVGWGLFDWFSKTTVRVHYPSRILQIDRNPPVDLLAIVELTVKEIRARGVHTWELGASTSRTRWFPLYFGTADEVRAIEAFINNARSKCAALAKSAVSGVTVKTLEQQAQELVAAIEQARGSWSGLERIYCYVLERPVAEAKPSVYVQLLEALDRLGDTESVSGTWLEFLRGNAREHAASAIRLELAYNHEMMAPEPARALADRFLSFFDPGARFFTVPPGGRVSAAQFDGGLMGRDARRVGLLWFESDSPGR